MKITKVVSNILRIPEDDPLADMPEEAGRLRPIVIVRIQTDNGLEGIGVTLYGGALTGTLRTAIDELGALLVGEDPLRIEALLRKMGAAAGDNCGSGIYTLAQAPIDVALWDIKGKALEHAAVEAARRRARPGADLCFRFAAAGADRSAGGDRGAPAGGQGLRRDEDADGAAGQSLARRGSAPRARGARCDRAGHQADVRHQPALAGRAGDRYRASRGGCRAVLAGGCHDLRRL